MRSDLHGDVPKPAAATLSAYAGAESSAVANIITCPLTSSIPVSSRVTTLGNPTVMSISETSRPAAPRPSPGSASRRRGRIRQSGSTRSSRPPTLRPAGSSSGRSLRCRSEPAVSEAPSGAGSSYGETSPANVTCSPDRICRRIVTNSRIAVTGFSYSCPCQPRHTPRLHAETEEQSLVRQLLQGRSLECHVPRLSGSRRRLFQFRARSCLSRRAVAVA